MGNVIRLNNGSTIQVRTGVLAGVGPQGPRGLIGPPGPDGPVGPTGESGPTGQILQMMTKGNIAAPFALSSGVDTNVGFTVAYDDMSLFASSSNIAMQNGADYLFSVWVTFELPAGTAAGYRQLKLVSTVNGMVAVQAPRPVLGEVTYVNLTYPYRCTTPGEIMRVVVKHNDTGSLNVSSGSVAINRVGSGPEGPAGPQGPTGLTGAQGPQGIQGAAGNAGSGFATYADLL